MKTLSNEEMKDFRAGAPAAAVLCVELFLDNSDWTVEEAIAYCAKHFPKNPE
jgi:hypothetical protein